MGDAPVVLTGKGLVAVHPQGGLQEFGAAPALGRGGSVAAYDAGGVDAFWRVSGNAGQVRAELLTDTGTVARRVVLPDGYVALAGDGVGGLLVVSPDQHLWRVPPDRDGVERLDTSLPLAVSGGHLATVRCDDRFVCGVEVVDLASGDRHLIPGSLQPGTFAALSPDGTRLAQVLGASDAVGPSTVVAVIDTGSGAQLTRQPYPPIPNGPPRWSPDGRWLVWSDNRGLEVCNVTDGSAPRSIAVPAAGGDALAVLAVVRRSA
jgi:WD40-like Beta Propeller Repeat